MAPVWSIYVTNLYQGFKGETTSINPPLREELSSLILLLRADSPTIYCYNYGGKNGSDIAHNATMRGDASSLHSHNHERVFLMYILPQLLCAGIGKVTRYSNSNHYWRFRNRIMGFETKIA